MALINCYECGNEISDLAISCPVCGCPISGAGGSGGGYSDSSGEIPEDIVALSTKLLAQETSPEVQAIKLQILKRIATESDVKPARIPAPLNITEIGGYLNLMMKLRQEAKQEQHEAQQEAQRKVFLEMLKQTLTSILGLPMQTPIE